MPDNEVLTAEELDLLERSYKSHSGVQLLIKAARLSQSQAERIVALETNLRGLATLLDEAWTKALKRENGDVSAVRACQLLTQALAPWLVKEENPHAR